MRVQYLPGVIAIASDFPRGPVQRFLRAREEYRPAVPGNGSPAAALAALIHRYSDHAEVGFGVVVAQEDSTVAMPLRVVIEAELTAAELTAGVDTARTDLIASSAGFDLDLMIEKLCETPVFDRHPLFQIAYCEVGGRRGIDLDAEQDALDAVVSCDLVFVADRGTGELHCEYDSELFEAATVGRLLSYWAELIGALTATPEARIGALPIAPAAEDAPAGGWSAGPLVARTATTVHALIAEQAVRH
ncbi:MAG: hypothetical protein ACRD0P_37835, partial [Stackebrandtia sp.]